MLSNNSEEKIIRPFESSVVESEYLENHSVKVWGSKDLLEVASL